MSAATVTVALSRFDNLRLREKQLWDSMAADLQDRVEDYIFTVMVMENRSLDTDHSKPSNWTVWLPLNPEFYIVPGRSIVLENTVTGGRLPMLWDYVESSTEWLERVWSVWRAKQPDATLPDITGYFEMYDPNQIPTLLKE